MKRSKIQVLEKKTIWGFPWVRCCVCSHEFYHTEDGDPECEWCSGWCKRKEKKHD